jgi:hypothetical protein
MKIAIFPLAVVCLGLFLGCAPAEAPFDATKIEKNPEAVFVDQMVAKANGDINQLSAEERTKLNQITRGNAEAVIKSVK